MAPSDNRTNYTEHLDLARTAETKYEYARGEVIAMTGASSDHNLIVGNLITTFNNQLHPAAIRSLP